MTQLINSALQNQIVSTFANGMDLINLLNTLNNRLTALTNSAVTTPMTSDLDAGGQSITNVHALVLGGAAAINYDGSASFAFNQASIDNDGVVHCTGTLINGEHPLTIIPTATEFSLGCVKVASYGDHIDTTPVDSSTIVDAYNTLTGRLSSLINNMTVAGILQYDS